MLTPNTEAVALNSVGRSGRKCLWHLHFFPVYCVRIQHEIPVNAGAYYISFCALPESGSPYAATIGGKLAVAATTGQAATQPANDALPLVQADESPARRRFPRAAAAQGQEGLYAL